MQDYDSAALETAVTTEESDDVIVASDDGEILEDTDREDVDGRPDECQCSEFNRNTELPCFPCWLDGFETVAE